jgi:hypothetical protein
MLQAAYNSFRQGARGFLLLEGEERAVRALSPAQHERVRSLVRAASARTLVAENLTDERQTVAALLLYREAVQLLVLAVLAKDREELNFEDADPAWIVSEFKALVDQGKVDTPPAEVEAALVFIGRQPPMAIDETALDVQVRTKESLEGAARWLRQRVDPRTVSEIRRARVIRTATAVVLGLLFLIWVVTRLLRPTDLALHRPVTASSRYPRDVAAADGSDLVNGVLEESYGFQTTKENSPWVMIDLQSSFMIKDVVIYNRGDGWFDEGLPFVLELSENGRDFTEVSRRAETFSQDHPWTYTAPAGIHARYVRVRAPHPGYISLSEIEVHGHK